MYSLDVIFPKYRNIIAVSSFYEYLLSGRCDKLEGAEGAYNIFESELRMNLIINKIDDVIKHLEKIEQHQYMLYSAIQENNKQVNQLSGQRRGDQVGRLPQGGFTAQLRGAHAVGPFSGRRASRIPEIASSLRNPLPDRKPGKPRRKFRDKKQRHKKV